MHVQKYMEIHNIFAYDLDSNDYATRMSIAYKQQQVLEKEGFGYSDDVCRRQSVVNLKGFIRDIKEEESHQRIINEETDEDAVSDNGSPMKYEEKGRSYRF